MSSGLPRYGRAGGGTPGEESRQGALEEGHRRMRDVFLEREPTCQHSRVATLDYRGVAIRVRLLDEQGRSPASLRPLGPPARVFERQAQAVDRTRALVLKAETLEAARALLPGWDVHALEAEWLGWWEVTGRPRLGSPDAAFLGWVRKKVS